MNHKNFVENEMVTWELSPYTKGIGIIRGKVEGMPGLDAPDDNWWIVELHDPERIEHYNYSCIALPSYRIDSIDQQISPFPLPKNS
jgi:hypothetical protein